jgi:hypothetical protein
MKELANKLCEIEKALSSTRGPFDLFALFLREDAANFWDVVVAAAWIDEDRVAALRTISERIQHDLPLADLMKISGVVIVDRTTPAFRAVTSSVGTQHQPVQVRGSTFFGLEIKEGFIITSQNQEAA